MTVMEVQRLVPFRCSEQEQENLVKVVTDEEIKQIPGSGWLHSGILQGSVAHYRERFLGCG